MKVHVVTFDSYLGGFGSAIHILGIYTSKEEADDAIKIATEQLSDISVPDYDYFIKEMLEEELASSNYFVIREIELNEKPNLKYDEDTEEVCGGTYIGGYIE